MACVEPVAIHSWNRANTWDPAHNKWFKQQQPYDSGHWASPSPKLLPPQGSLGRPQDPTGHIHLSPPTWQKQTHLKSKIRERKYSNNFFKGWRHVEIRQWYRARTVWATKQIIIALDYNPQNKINIHQSTLKWINKLRRDSSSLQENSSQWK